MGWYDWFARVYDDSLQPLYAEQREAATAALDVRPDLGVLDVPCGTGQSFPSIVRQLGAEGRLLGIDLSDGMLRQAKRRCESDEYPQVRLLNRDAGELKDQEVQELLGQAQVDRLHVFLGMSVFPDMQRTFNGLWRLLKPGGRCVLVDVHTPQLGFQGHMVNLIARADISRRFWKPLQEVAQDFELRDLTHNPKHGGQIMLATGVKPAGA